MKKLLALVLCIFLSIFAVARASKPAQIAAPDGKGVIHDANTGEETSSGEDDNKDDASNDEGEDVNDHDGGDGAADEDTGDDSEADDNQVDDGDDNGGG